MRRAFSKPTTGDAEYERLLSGFRAEGYEGLQLKMGQFVPWLDEPDAFIAAWGDDPGRVSSLIHFDTLEPHGLLKLASTIRFAEAVGSERVVFCHNHPRKGVTRNDLVAFARTLSDFAADAAARGVALSLHHHFDQPVMTPDDVEAFFEAVDPGTVGLTVDTAHVAKSGVEDIPAFIHRFPTIVDNVHLKDYDGERWRLLGQGQLDLDGILTALDDIGYSGWLCVDEESDATLDEGFAQSRRWLDARG